MNITETRKLLNIIEKVKGPNAWLIAAAEHDVVYLELEIADVPQDSADGKILDELGCSVDEFGGWILYV